MATLAVWDRDFPALTSVIAQRRHRGVRPAVRGLELSVRLSIASLLPVVISALVLGLVALDALTQGRPQLLDAQGSEQSITPHDMTVRPVVDSC